MSNLFKQYNTVEPFKDVRVIDYNPMVEEKLAELAKRQSGGKILDEGFRELGRIAEEIPKEDPEEIIERRMQEAEEALNHAREEAKALLAKAQEQSEEIRQKAMEEGHKEGYEAGYEQAVNKLETEYGQRKEELEQLEAERQAEYDRQLQDLEPKLLDAVLTVVEKAFHIQFDDKKEIMLHLVSDAMADIEGCKHFCIRVCREQKDFLEGRKEEIVAAVGRDITLEISADVSMEPNECIIETDTGIFDCGINVQLGNLIKDLRALSS